MDHIKPQKIPQFRTMFSNLKKQYLAYQDVDGNWKYGAESTLPTIPIYGTVKVHGTNASVVICEDGTQYPQSKKSKLSLLSDNFGFAAWHLAHVDIFNDMYGKLKEKFQLNGEVVVVYGEWAGAGIQSGVAVNDVYKFFYIYGVKLIKQDYSIWLDDYPILTYKSDRVFDSRDFGVYHLDLDLQHPQECQNKLVELTNAVELECPVAKKLGSVGLGEGIVWIANTDNGRFIMKVKGEKHSVTKTKTLASISTEKLDNIQAFIEYAVTDNRIAQMHKDNNLNGYGNNNIKPLIIAVTNDIIEEESDTLVDSGLCLKDLRNSIPSKIREWLSKQPI